MLVELVFTLDDFPFLTFVGNFVAVAGLLTPGHTKRRQNHEDRNDPAAHKR